MVIGILGEKLAGKDTVAEYLVSRYGAEHIRASKILDELLGVLRLPVTRRDEIDAGRGMEMVFGQHIIGEAVKKRALESGAPMVVINGLRRPDQFADAKSLGGKIIYITAPPELRYQRFLRRKEKKEDGTESLEQFLLQEQEWIEKEIPGQGALADFRIDNSGSLEELYQKAEEIIKKLR